MSPASHRAPTHEVHGAWTAMVHGVINVVLACASPAPHILSQLHTHVPPLFPRAARCMPSAAYFESTRREVPKTPDHAAIVEFNVSVSSQPCKRWMKRVRALQSVLPITRNPLV